MTNTSATSPRPFVPPNCRASKKYRNRSFAPSKTARLPSLNSSSATQSGYLYTNIPQTGHFSSFPGLTKPGGAAADATAAPSAIAHASAAATADRRTRHFAGAAPGAFCSAAALRFAARRSRIIFVSSYMSW